MITFENVSKKYRGTQRPALDGINLQVDRGEFVFIVGASGSGKSSCLQLILREELATSGTVHVLGQNLKGISTRKVPFFRRNLGMVFQDFRLLQNKNVYDNVAFSLQVIGKSRGFIQEAVPDTLEMVGLGGKGKRFPHELSGGEQQRVAIARAAVNRPAILLADEPTGNLDPATSLGIMQLLQAINAGGTTVVMATHEATFVDIMKERVVELSEGQVVRDEERGGYGETASVPIEDLRKAGLRHPLRTSEEAMREALSAEEEAARNAGRDRMQTHDRTGAADSGADVHGAAGGIVAASAGRDEWTSEDFEPVDEPAPIEPREESARESAFSHTESDTGTQAGSAHAEPDVAADESAADGRNRQFADTGQPERTGQSDDTGPQAPNPEYLKKAPDLSELEETLDPITLARRGLAEGGGMAERLGLESDDDDSDVGPVK
jgi:cell division transport system ATP-binding protein